MCHYRIIAFAFLASLCPTPTTASSPVSAVNLGTSGKQSFLSAHNTERLRLGIPGLDWNDTLARSAADHAVKCEFKHSHGPYGENIYYSGGYDDNVVTVAKNSVDAWLSERPNVVDPKWPCLSTLTCGHYTQVVWRKTTTVGCAITHCGKPYANLVVCQYYPSGNYKGQSPY